MRLLRYSSGSGPRVGIGIVGGVIDARAALDHLHRTHSPCAQAWLRADPGDMTAFLSGGEPLLNIFRSELPHGGLKDHRQLWASEVFVADAEVTIHAPLSPADKFICTWINYDNDNSHVVAPERREPIFFSKFFSAVVGPGDAIRLPSITADVMPEAEIVAVIGSAGRHIDEADALAHVAGFTILNDVTALSHSLKSLIGVVAPYMMAKTSPTFAPCGPWIVTRDDIGDVGDLAVRCWIDDRLVVESSTSGMLTPFPKLIAYLSRFFELKPGDVIASGGAPWLSAEPPILHAGQTVRIEFEGLGVLENDVLDDDPPSGGRSG